jgi:hypothetical protein
MNQEEEKGEKVMKSGNALETRCAQKNSPLVSALVGPCFKNTPSYGVYYNIKHLSINFLK